MIIENGFGYVIAYRNEHNAGFESYYDETGIGDWSVAGDARRATIFESFEQAMKVANDCLLDIMKITIKQITYRYEYDIS